MSEYRRNHGVWERSRGGVWSVVPPESVPAEHRATAERVEDPLTPGERADERAEFALKHALDVNPRVFPVLGEDLHAGNFAALTAALFGGTQRSNYFANNRALCEAGRYVEHLVERVGGPRGRSSDEGDHRVIADDDFDAETFAALVRES
jgi:hypothetical protein